MSSEAGSVFPLSRPSVFDFCPLSPTNKAANTIADIAAILSADVSASDSNPSSPPAAYACSPTPQTSRVTAQAHTETLIHTHSFPCFM